MESLFEFSAPKQPSTTHLLHDPWLAKSALQKAIRRGEAADALNATAFLLSSQPRSFWKRLVVIALEDIGVANLPLVHEVLSISGRQAWRNENGGDWAIGSQLVTALCRSIKCRDACDALVVADLHPDLMEQRSAFLDLSSEELSKIVIDDQAYLWERVLAAWLIAGTKRFPSPVLPMREGRFAELLAVYEQMGIDRLVLETARLGSTRTMEGHSISLPLIWLLATNSTEKGSTQNCLIQSDHICGWPAYAYDMHTRIGKRAIVNFISECRELYRMISKWLSRDQHDIFVGTLIFRLEGENLDRRLTYEGSQALLRASEIAHLTYQGLPENLVYDALSVARVHSNLLHKCRIEAARGYWS